MTLLEEVTSLELKRLVERGVTTAVIPFGSVEYQERHLPLGADTLLADAVGRAVGDRLNAVVAPTVRVGCADEHMRGAGTLSVPAETLRDAATHIADSLIAHGFRVVVLVSIHGGNRDAIEHAVRDLEARHRDTVVCAPRGELGPDPGRHSGRWLTSVMLSLRPDLVHIDAARDELQGELRDANADIGAANLERFISSILQQVREAVLGSNQ
jgi:creatinine amidohydrolase/Fe(II)-dependent formamide hydrolase-like protein